MEEDDLIKKMRDHFDNIDLEQFKKDWEEIQKEIEGCPHTQIIDYKIPTEPHFNHNRPLSDFQEDIDLLKLNGFNPIGVSQMYMFEVFIFNTEEEAERAYQEMDVKRGEIVAYFWEKKDFLKEVERYENYDKENQVRVLIHWF
jgi:hypothetical protein